MFGAVAEILSIVVRILQILIVARAIISWVNPDPYNPIVIFLKKVTEPILYPIRKLLPIGMSMGIDLSPIIALLALVFIDSFLVSTLRDLSIRMR